MSLKLDDYLITGRTFTEYVAFFNLDVMELQNKRILDCPSGASSFVAEARNLDIDAQGCDVLYKHDITSIIRQARKSIDIIYEDISWMKGHSMSFYKDVSNHRLYRERAVDFFCKDYNQRDYHFATLPNLPFEDDSFDLLLSSHLLFVYDDRLDYEFHKNSILEMLRVAKEVRIFSLVDYKNSKEHEELNFSGFVYKITEDLQNFRCEVLQTNFEFQKRGNFCLKITRS